MTEETVETEGSAPDPGVAVVGAPGRFGGGFARRGRRVMSASRNGGTSTAPPAKEGAAEKGAAEKGAAETSGGATGTSSGRGAGRYASTGEGAPKDRPTTSSALRVPRVPRLRRPGGGARTVGARNGVPVWVTVVLSLVTLAAVIVALSFAAAWSSLNSQNVQRSQVKATATTFLYDLFNLSPKNIDTRFNAIESMATGNFAKQANQFFGSNIRQALEQAQAQSQGQIRYVYVQSIDGNQATVYALVDQTYLNNKLPAPQPDVMDMTVGLTQVGGTWKIATATVLSAPSTGTSGNASAAVPSTGG